MNIRSLPILLLPCLAVAWADDWPHAENTQKAGEHPPAAGEQVARMTLPDGFHVTLFAAEPDIRQPVSFTFDDRGRLWVSHFRQYPYPAGLKQISRDKYYRAKYDQEPKAPPNHYPGRSKVTIHEDTNQDGRFDRHTVFLEGLDLANAALPDHDGVWVMHTPYLLFYPDRDRDDKPDGDPEVHLAQELYQ